MYEPINISATTIPDAWFQTVYKCIEKGKDFKIDRGSFEGEKRLEFDYITIHIKHPGSKPLTPDIPAHYNIPNPVPDGYLDDYITYLMTGEMKPGESYTYGQRMNAYPIDSKVSANMDRSPDKVRAILKGMQVKKQEEILIQEDEIWDAENIIVNNGMQFVLNQIELIIWTYKNKGYRNNQMVLQVAHPTDMLLKDPPCLRSIDTRIQDGKLHFIIYFRSWDLWAGLPANLAGIQMMKEYMASEIGVEDGEMICASKGLHLYNYVWELAEIMRGKTIEEFRKGE